MAGGQAHRAPASIRQGVGGRAAAGTGAGGAHARGSCWRLAPPANLRHRPLRQVWLPKNTVAGKPFWLSAEAAPFIMSDTALNGFREKRRAPLREGSRGANLVGMPGLTLPAPVPSCEVVYCKGQGLPGRVWSSGACEVVRPRGWLPPGLQQHSTLHRRASARPQPRKPRPIDAPRPG